MFVGLRVYHRTLRLNLIVCQVDIKGNIVCVNPNIFYTDANGNDVHPVLTVNSRDLERGWKTSYE